MSNASHGNDGDENPRIHVPLFGPSEVGKTTFLENLAQCEDWASQKYDRNVAFTPSAELNQLRRTEQSLKDDASVPAVEDQADGNADPSKARTLTYSEYSFGIQYKIPGANGCSMRFATHDFAGEKVLDVKLYGDTSLKTALSKARGILLFIDDVWLKDQELAIEYATLLDYIEEQWHARHMPIAIVISKLDLITDHWERLKNRPFLIPEDIQRPLLHSVPEDSQRWQSETPLERLRESVLSDAVNCQSMEIYNLTERVLTAIEPLLQRVLERTYRYQVFCLSSINKLGVFEVMRWLADELYYPFLHDEVKRLEREVAKVTNSPARKTELRHEIDEVRKEIKSQSRTFLDKMTDYLP